MSTFLSIASAVASTTVGIVGSIQGHQQAKANAKMQAAQFQYNKRQAELEAAKTDAITAENVRRQREISAQLKARQRAMLGKSGAALASGSPLAILGETAAEEELKVQDIAIQGYNQAEEFRNKARLYDYQSKVAKSSAPSDSSLALNIAGQVAKGVTGMMTDPVSKFINDTSSSLYDKLFLK